MGGHRVQTQRRARMLARKDRKKTGAGNQEQRRNPPDGDSPSGYHLALYRQTLRYLTFRVGGDVANGFETLFIIARRLLHILSEQPHH
jgi:hypothetical protein